MYPPRRKCRKVFVWICFAVVAQIIFSLFLHGEFNLAPIRRNRTTKKVANGIKSRLRLQSQDVEQMEENLKFIARTKLDDARGNDDGVDYRGRFVIKSTAFPLFRKNLQNPLQVIRRNNHAVNLSARMITQEVGKHESVYHNQTRAKENNIGHEFRTEYREGTRITELKDIFISVKTTGDFHETRVTVLQYTWFQNARDQVRQDDRIFLLPSFDQRVISPYSINLVSHRLVVRIKRINY